MVYLIVVTIVLDSALKPQLAPSLIHGCRRRVGQVHRTARRDHRNAHLLGDTWVIKMLWRQAGGLGAKEEDIAFLELDVREPLIGMRAKSKHARAGQCVHAGVEVLVDVQVSKVVVVQASAL